jgi:hypothetical protein
MPRITDDAMRTHRQHPITRSFRLEYERCLAPSRRRRIEHRWTAEPALAGRAIEGIVEVFRRRQTNQNEILETLIRLHQDGDRDATTVLMVIIYPVVIAAARRLTSDLQHRYDAAWAAAGHALATIDPAQARQRADHYGHPMLAHLGHRLRNSDWALNPSDRNHERRRKHPAATAVSVVSLSDERTPEPVDPTDVDLAAQLHARTELELVAASLVSGAVTQVDWQFLINHRFHRVTRASARDRARAHRTTRRLGKLIGRAAA